MSERESPTFEKPPAPHVESLRLSDLMGRPMHTPEPEPEQELEPEQEPELQSGPQPQPNEELEPEPEPHLKSEPETGKESPRIPSVHFRPKPTEGWSFKPLAQKNFCCVAKEYYSEYCYLVDSLNIMPRLMIQRQPLRRDATYGLTLSIRNTGLYPRLINVRTDSESDTTITIDKYEMHRYLDTDKVLTVKISICSKTANKINRTRHIFIDSFHPNITFQVPIIVLKKDVKEPEVCEYLKLPSTVPNDTTYFEMIIYNSGEQPVRVKYRSSFMGLKLNYLGMGMIQRHDYTKVLLCFTATKLQVYKGFFNVKFGLNPPNLVVFDFVPKSMSAYVNRGFISFGRAKFTDSFMRTFNICNESAHSIDLHVDYYATTAEIIEKSASCNTFDTELSSKMYDEAVSMHSVLLFDFNDEKQESRETVLNEDAKIHFVVKAPTSIANNTSSEVTVTFHPAFDNESSLAAEGDDPPYMQRTKIIFCITDSYECIESHYVLVQGEIDGIEVEVFPQKIEFRRIYLGEEHCAFIKVLNIDAVNAKVKYKDSLDAENCAVQIRPIEGFMLSPCERNMFHLSFYTVQPKLFSVTLRFKVDNGGIYSVDVTGVGTPVQLRTFPHLVEFGSIPFAIPQKRFMLLMNPLAVPITFQVQTTEDGEEQPLVFNIREPSKILPITIKDPIKELQFAKEDMMADTEPECNIEFSTREPDEQSIHSISINESVYSLDFEENVLEPIPAIAAHLLQTLKKQKIFDKTETDKRVIHEALASLLNINYFNIFNKHNNFIFMDWHAIPSDPKEIYCDNEIIYLRPNTGRSITILLIPNKLGYYRRSLTVRICPALPKVCTETSDDQQFKSLIRSELMCSKLWFEYNCCAPDIDWNNYVDLTDRIIYAGEEYGFQMVFTNMSSIAGFLHFDVIPNEMSFFDGIWKHYIGSMASVTAECLVTFRVLGKNKLSGLVKIVGDPHPYSFHLFGHVLATEIRITPLFVHKRIQVFEEDRVHFYIDNFTPTNTKLIMKLKDERFQYLTTRGGMLAPTGQSMYTTLVSLYTDPDLYYNTMSIDLQFDHVIKIPITYLVEGVPLWFSPDIKKNGFDAGFLFTDLKVEFQANLFKNRFQVKVINKGTRVYRITINRLKTYNPDLKPTACANQPLTARFEMHPKLLEINPNSEAELEILISGYEEGTFYCDFMLTITDTTYPQRKQVIKVPVKATFAECQLSWHASPMIINYKPCEPLKERTYFRTAHLINCNNMKIEHVYLEAAGPFRIKAMYEHCFEKHLVISLDKLECREIYILLNKAMVKNLSCNYVEGRIAVFAEGKMQKHLTINVIVFRPDLNIITSGSELVLFDRGHPYSHTIEIGNDGCATAMYKWKRIDVRETFIGADDSADLVAEVLSEILRMLEYNFTCDEEPNMTLRYHKCRCQFRRETEVGSLIFDILDEIINELDLSQRRFLIRMDNVDPLHDDSEAHSSSSFVQYTIDYILDQLNLESSQQLSGPSSDYCFSDRFIYFYEKSGTLHEWNVNKCELHLPHVRRSHEMKSVFSLEVVGQRSRTLTVTLVNLLHKIKFLKDNIYLNIRPWYETYNATFNITNLTKYPLELFILPIVFDEKPHVAGHAKLTHDNFMLMEPNGSDKIKVSGILGLNDNFVRVFAMVINDSANCYFRLRGQGILPILSVTTPLPKLEQSPNDIIEEYEFLRIIYNYETFKSITEWDKDGRGNLEEDGVGQESPETPDFSLLSESYEDMPSERQQYYDQQLFLMIHTYVQVFNNQELPNAIILDQMIVTERYLHKLRVQPHLNAIHEKVYKAYVDLQQPSSSLRRSNVNHFTVQPLPCEHVAYGLDLGPLLRDTLRRFELRLQFFGPGKLIAAARTVVRVPGLYVDFMVENHADKKFTYWAEKCNAPEFFNTGYRNFWERLTDAGSPRMQYAHSFDLDCFLRHQRDITDKDRKQIADYYNSLNPSVYPDHKHHFTLARILTSHHSNFSGIEMRMIGLFKPESKYYEKDQKVFDYIYIDLHMGPTLPILLQGVIK